MVTTIAGFHFHAMPMPSFKDGIGTFARFNYPNGIGVDSAGNLFIAESSNFAVRLILTSTMEVVTIAGSYPMESNGYADGIGTFAQFTYPSGISVKDGGVVYVADVDNKAIRKLRFKYLRRLRRINRQVQPRVR